MLSNHIITTQRLVAIIDNVGLNVDVCKFLEHIVHEQGKFKIKTLPLNAALKEKKTLNEFIKQCNENDSIGGEWNVILPDIADFLIYQKPSEIFLFLKHLDKCTCIERIIFYVSVKNVAHPDSAYIVGGLEYMSNMTIFIETDKELRIVTRKPGGSITNIRYFYVQNYKEFTIEPVESAEKPVEEVKEEQPKPTEKGTFKIELEEEELVARNSLKLPYEKSTDAGGNIIYTPDANDDFDDEDPDEDLCI